MSQKTKTQLRDELEQAKELAEVQAKTQAEVTAARESEQKLQESELVWFPDPSCMGGARKTREGRVW